MTVEAERIQRSRRGRSGALRLGTSSGSARQFWWLSMISHRRPSESVTRNSSSGLGMSSTCSAHSPSCPASGVSNRGDHCDHQVGGRSRAKVGLRLCSQLPVIVIFSGGRVGSRSRRPPSCQPPSYCVSPPQDCIVKLSARRASSSCRAIHWYFFPKRSALWDSRPMFRRAIIRSNSPKRSGVHPNSTAREKISRPASSSETACSRRCPLAGTFVIATDPSSSACSVSRASISESTSGSSPSRCLNCSGRRAATNLSQPTASISMRYSFSLSFEGCPSGRREKSSIRPETA